MRTKFFLPIVSFFVLTNCDRVHLGSLLDSKVKTFANSTLSVQDSSGNPISGAQILIGDAVGDPFGNNFLVTNNDGKLDIPSDWKSSATVSVSATGFVTASFLHTQPIASNFKLRKQTLQSTIEYSGNTIGYLPFDDLSIGHISLVFEALKKADLVNFSLSNLVSVESDTFSILGSKVTVPSNLSIPDQTLSYIIHINLSKPQFHIPLQTNSDHMMVGLHAQFPVTDLVKAIRNKDSIFDMLNFFDFTSFSQQTQHVDNINVDRDIDISSTFFSMKSTVQAQKFDDGLVLLTLSVLDQNDAFVPLDIKSVSSGSNVALNTLSNKHTSEKYIGILRSVVASPSDTGVSQEVVSIAVHDASTSTLTDQLGILTPPTLTGNQIDQPLLTATPQTITAAGMYYSYTGVVSQLTGKMLVETKTPTWDVYNPIWEEKISLPSLPEQMKVKDTGSPSHRWVISLLGQDNHNTSELGPDRLKNVNYFTRTGVDTK